MSWQSRYPSARPASLVSSPRPSHDCIAALASIFSMWDLIRRPLALSSSSVPLISRPPRSPNLDPISIVSDLQSRGIGRSRRMFPARWGRHHALRVARQTCNRSRPGRNRRAPPEFASSTSKTTARMWIAAGDAGYPHPSPNPAGWRMRRPDRCVNLRRLPVPSVRDVHQSHERQSKILADGRHRSPSRTHASRRTKLRGSWSGKAGERLHRLPSNCHQQDRSDRSARRPAGLSATRQVHAAIALQRSSVRSPSSPGPCQARTASRLSVERIL